MIAPVSKLKKEQIVWLQTNRCRHNHTYFEHYICYLEEIVNGSGWEKTFGKKEKKNGKQKIHKNNSTK